MHCPKTDLPEGEPASSPFPLPPCAIFLPLYKKKTLRLIQLTVVHCLLEYKNLRGAKVIIMPSYRILSKVGKFLVLGLQQTKGGSNQAVDRSL